MYQVLGAELGDGVEVVAAHRVAFAHNAAADLGPVVDAEGADVDDAFEFAQSGGF